MKDENTQIIKELEEEFSDEKIAEIFQVDFFRKNKKGGRRIRRARRSVLREIISIAAVVICVAVMLQFFSFRIVFERSMDYTISSGDCLVLSKRAYTFSDVGFGDIVLHESRLLDDKGKSRDLIKRVVGLPGDIIEIRSGSVFRNGQWLNESYTKDSVTDEVMLPVTVPEGCYFVLGDNRLVSIDSRDARVGFVRKDQILGKVVFRLLPVSKAGKLF